MTTATNIANAWINPTLPDIFYEAAEPVEDGMLEGKAMDRITQLLRERYGEREDVFISTRGKIFICYDQTNGNARVAPDLFIAFSVPATTIEENLPNFWIWETGKAPDLVIEAASESTAANDLGDKRRLYEGLGIPEYWRLDPSAEAKSYGERLAGDRLVNGRYVPCETRPGPQGSVRAYSGLLELDFYWDEATGFDLLDPATGRTIALLPAAEERADAAETRADAERTRADAAEERVRQLEEELLRRPPGE